MSGPAGPIAVTIIFLNDVTMTLAIAGPISFLIVCLIDRLACR
jgi:hypothetical protein